MCVAGLFGFAGAVSSAQDDHSYTCLAPNGAHFGSATPCLDYHDFDYPSVYDYPGFGYFDLDVNGHHPYRDRYLDGFEG